MSSKADLFVVCQQCGSEVSPYVTECPYCGRRLRRRAPKLPREIDASRSPARARKRRSLLGPSLSRARRPRLAQAGAGASRPYATIAVVALSCATWVAWHIRPELLLKLTLIGPPGGDWWKLISTQFTYGNGLYEFLTVLTIAIFGWLLERRSGPAVVLALFLGAGVCGALVAAAVYPLPIVSGGNAAALALLAAWAAPDLEAARAGHFYEGDLLGAGAFAAVILLLPFARPEASWLAGVTGAAIGLLFGLGLARAVPQEG